MTTSNVNNDSATPVQTPQTPPISSPPPGATKTDNVALYLPSVLGYEKIARRAAEAVAEQMDFDLDRIEDLKTAVAEACMNAIEHGNAFERGVNVAVHMTILPDKLEVRVADVGRQLVPDELPEPGSGDMRGWGFFFIQNLVDEMEIIKLPDGGNEIRMVLYLQRQPDADAKADAEASADKPAAAKDDAADKVAAPSPSPAATETAAAIEKPAAKSEAASPAVEQAPPATAEQATPAKPSKAAAKPADSAPATEAEAKPATTDSAAADKPTEPQAEKTADAAIPAQVLAPVEKKPSAVQPTPAKPAAVQPVQKKPSAVQPVADKPRAIQPADTDTATSSTPADTTAADAAPTEHASSTSQDAETSPES